jgi:hypothetical protein
MELDVDCNVTHEDKLIHEGTKERHDKVGAIDTLSLQDVSIESLFSLNGVF